MSKSYKIIVPQRDEFTERDVYVVKEIGTYPRGSVLAGQSKITFLESFDFLNDAKFHHPDAEVTHELLQPTNTFDHLPDTPDI